MRYFVRPVFAAIALTAIALPAVAQPPADEARYRACIAQIEAEPLAAYETGLAWQAQAGGWPAAHCTALAIVATGDFAEGARRLEINGEGAVAAGPRGRAVMFGQAGDAWLAGGQPSEALRAFTRGRDFAPQDGGLALGAAEAAIEAGLWEIAAEHAGSAIALMPDSAEGYRLRGRAKLELSDLDAAESDMRAARERAPENVEVLLLRGDIREARRTAG